MSAPTGSSVRFADDVNEQVTPAMAAMSVSSTGAAAPAAAAAAPAAASAPSRHRPNQTMTSMDFNEESRDTIDVKDSDTWYPQFSPSASLGPVGKLEAEKQTGLNALLQNRMDRAHFQERFLRPGSAEEAAANAALQSNCPVKLTAKEVTAESMFNTRRQLGALLANRPDKQRLERLHILPAPSSSNASNAFAGMQAQLEASKRKDKLNNLLSARPSFDALSKRGIVQERELKARESQGRLANAKATLGDFMLSRPKPEQVVAQKILTDVGALPGGLERKQENALLPVAVSTGSLAGKKVVSVSLGFSHTLALDAEGTVHVFGSGANGRLGVAEGSFADVAVPAALPSSHFGGEAVASIDAGENHSAAITKGGRLFMWGTGAWGRLGLGTQEDASVPREVALPDGAQVKAVSCGAYHTLALSSSGKLYAFGWNKNGRCGLGRKHPSLLVLTPTEVAFFGSASPPVQIGLFEAGQGSSFVASQDGQHIYTFGSGSFGVLGHGDEADAWEPRAVSALAGHVLSRAALGATHMLVVTNKGELLSFGNCDKGQLGRACDDAVSPSPASSSSSSSAAAACASPTSKSSFFTPARVSIDAAGARYIAAGKSHSLLVDGSGQLLSFGMGSRGVLGLGGESDQPFPVLVEALKGQLVRCADAAWTHSAAVTDDGVLYTFGAKNNGRLGV